MLRSDVDPKAPRTARPAPGDPRPPHPAHAHLRSAARARDRAGDQTHVGARAAGRARCALPRAAAARNPAVDRGKVGRVRQQPPGPFLFADRARPQAARRGNQQVAAPDNRDPAHPRIGTGGRVVRCFFDAGGRSTTSPPRSNRIRSSKSEPRRSENADEPRPTTASTANTRNRSVRRGTRVVFL